MSYLIGTDIGTTGTKSVITDLDGKVLATAYEEYEPLSPRQGWMEQWPDVWLKACTETIKHILDESKPRPEDVAGLCISSLYGGSGILCDGEMKPLRPCIIWADRRATEECHWIKERIGVDRIFEVTGNIVDPYYGYTKMVWIREHEPQIWSRTKKIMTPNAFCIYHLTGAETIDLSSAGNYGGFFELRKREWSEELMSDLGIHRSLFPERIANSEDVVGELTAEGSRLTGLKAGTPVSAGGIDAAVSALAGGAVLEGDLASMLGTSMCNGFISLGKKTSPRMVNFPHVARGNQYTYSFTGITTAGYCVRWFRDEFARLEKERAEASGKDSYALLDEDATRVPPGSEGLVFLPHMMTGERAPYWNEHLRGAFLGLTIGHKKPHMFRAVLEGVAYAMRYSIEAAKDAGLSIKRATLVDGGAKSSLWRQIIADVTGIDMDYIPGSPGAPLGDAFLAGLGSKAIKSYEVVENWLGNKVRVFAERERWRTYDRSYQLYLRCLDLPIFREIGELVSK